MIIEVTETIFVDTLSNHSRTKNWSHEAMTELFAWMDANEESDLELNPVNIDMEWTEYDEALFISEWEYTLDEDEIDEEWEQDELADAIYQAVDRERTVIKLDNGNYLVQTSY